MVHGPSGPIGVYAYGRTYKNSTQHAAKLAILCSKSEFFPRPHPTSPDPTPSTPSAPRYSIAPWALVPPPVCFPKSTARAYAIGKARSPSVERLIDSTTCSMAVSEERRLPAQTASSVDVIGTRQMSGDGCQREKTARCFVTRFRTVPEIFSVE